LWGNDFFDSDLVYRTKEAIVGEELRAGLGQAWNLVATFVPKLIGFLIILLIGWLIAKAISKALGFVLNKVGFNRLIDRTGLTHTMRNSGLDATNIIVKLAYYFVLLIALNMAFSAFGPGNPVSNLLNDVIAFLPKIAVAIVLVIVAAAVARVVRDLITSALGNRPFAPMLSTVAYVFILAIGIIAALNQVNIATTVTTPILITVLATIGAVVAIGLGGGLIKPMQERWSGWLDRFQSQMNSGAPQPRAEEPPASSAASSSASSAVRSDMRTPPTGMARPPR